MVSPVSPRPKGLTTFLKLFFPMPVTKRFYKDPDGRWYIDLPEYIEQGLGTKDNLEMVSGADTLLDNLSEESDSIMIKFDDQPFDGHTVHLIRSNQDDEVYAETDPDLDSGGWYHYYSNPRWFNRVLNNFHLVWLCPVTLYVFNGAYPKNIYIQKV